MSITSGIGLVSQLEKFGREIAGNSYKNYYVIHNGDFAYNKSSTKLYSEGEIALFEDDEVGAVPNSIFTCFRFDKKKVFSTFAKYPFVNNLHGNWLRKFIAVGARANGALQVNIKDLFSVPFTYPNLPEQQKIAACLSSLDEVIAAHREKLETLQDHKKGLMQNLFPQEGETVPAYRFPEFRGDGEWVTSTLGKVASISSGGTPSRAKKEYWNGDIPWISTTLIDFKKIENSNEYISESGLKNSSTKMLPKNTILMAMYGQGKTRGKVAILGIDATINQACASITLKNDMNTEFVFQNLASRYDEIRSISNSGGQQNLSGDLIKRIPFLYPSPSTGEQQKIASCLSSLDELITAQTEKIAQLQLHKKGLMQGLFPKN